MAPPKPKVAVSLLNDRQAYQLRQAEDARSTAQKAGIDLEVVFSDNNSVVQILQLFNFVHARPEERPIAIVAETASASGFERVARAAVETGIGWVLVSTYAPYLDDLRSSFPKVLVSCAVSNDEEIGRMEKKQCQALLPNGGRVLYLEGPHPNASARIRRKAFEEALLDSQLKISTTLSADWTEAGAERILSAWLRLKPSRDLQPDLIVSQNDAMAIGARKAIAENCAEWTHIPLLGCDGLPDEGQRLVSQGLLAATIVKPTTAGQGVELVARSLRGESIPPSVVLPPVSIPTVEALFHPWEHPRPPSVS